MSENKDHEETKKTKRYKKAGETCFYNGLSDNPNRYFTLLRAVHWILCDFTDFTKSITVFILSWFSPGISSDINLGVCPEFPSDIIPKICSEDRPGIF